MFDFLFGWRKASKCKNLIRRLQCRLKLLKNKRCSIVRQFREDMAQLLKIGHEEIAFNRAEQLYKDECIMEVYELLDHFCEFIIIQLPYIRRHKDCPNDINGAVSSLIFASARCGDLPELRAIRKLFGERYGQRFALTAVELLPGNLVNNQIKEKLSVNSVPDYVKHELVFELFREHCLHSGPLALEYSSEWHQQQLQAKERPGNQLSDQDVKSYHDMAEELQMGDLKVTEMEVEAVYFDSSLTDECLSLVGGNDISSTSSTSSKVLESSLEIAESSKPKKAEKIENFATLDSPYKFRISAGSSSELSSWIPEENVIYLDDIEEFQTPLRKDGKFQDQRVFIFKTEKVEDGYKENYSSRKNRKAAGKRLRKRSIPGSKSNTHDADCAVYYGRSFPNQDCRFSHQRKHQKMILMDNVEANAELDKDELETPPWKENKRTMTCPPKETEKRSKKTENEADGITVSSNGSCSKGTSPGMSRRTRTPYLRAMTMPQTQPKKNENEIVARSISLPTQQVNHVHPKLPDYDELAAKFTALKLVYLQNKPHQSKDILV